jgi:hypothetical protein
MPLKPASALICLELGGSCRIYIFMNRSVSFFIGLAAVLAASTGPCAGLGISSWCGWRPGQVCRAECPELRSVPLVMGWSKLEPEPGRYAFDEEIGESVRAAVADGLYVTLMVWVRPSTPAWLFEKGVPKVYTDRQVDPLGRGTASEDNLHPYYFSAVYKESFFRLIEELGRYVNGLSEELREHILFIQSAEGSTGDGQPYKGEPLDSRYNISGQDWNGFRRETWLRYQKAFPGIPILVNSDANTEEETAWMFDNMDVIALKHGMFSHGYHVSDNIGRLEAFEAVAAEAARRGIPVLTRGEMDGEMRVYGWVHTQHPAGALLVGFVCNPLSSGSMEYSV